MDNQRNGFMARYLVELSPELALTTTAYYNTFKRDWYKANSLGGSSLGSIISSANGGDPTAIGQLHGNIAADLEVKSNSREYVSKGLDFKADWMTSAAGMDHNLTFGVRYHEDEVDRFQPVDNFRQEIFNGQPAITYVSTTQPTGGDNRIEEAEAWSAYIADRIDVTDRLEVTALLRYEDFETQAKRYADVDRTTIQAGSSAKNSTSELLPGIGMTYDLNDEVILLGGVHRGMRPAGAGSTDVDPEISINYEAGVRLHRGEFFGEAIAFYSDYSNTVQYCSLANPCGSQTSGSISKGESTIAGLETLVGYEIPLGGGLTAPLSATWTYTDAEITKDSDDGSVLDGDNLAYLPEQVFNVRAGLRSGELWDAYVDLAYVDEMCINGECNRAGSTKFDKTEAYTVVNFSGSYQVAPGARVFTKIANLMDDQKIVSRSPYGARPNLPRTAYLGMSVDF